MNTSEPATPAKAVRPPPCMSATASGDAVSLTLHFANGDLLSLPWSRYVGASLTDDKLVISFAEREIEVHGRNLEKVMDAIERSSLSGLRELPAVYAGLAGTEPFVIHLDVHPSARANKRNAGSCLC